MIAALREIVEPVYDDAIEAWRVNDYAPNSSESPYNGNTEPGSAWDEECDRLLAEIQSALPPGWEATWGDNDLRISRIEAMPLDEALAYVQRHQDDAEEIGVLIARLAPVILGRPSLLRAAITAAWGADLGAEIAKVCTGHAAELERIDRAAAEDALGAALLRTPIDLPAPEQLQALIIGVRALHAQVDQTDPNDPIGIALTRAGLERPL